MNRNTVEWIVGAIVSICLGTFIVLLGANLIPARVEAQEDGIIVPWVIGWTLVWLSALIAAAIAGFLIMLTRNDRATQ